MVVEIVMDLCQFSGAKQVATMGVMQLASTEGFVVEVFKLEVRRYCDVKSLELGVQTVFMSVYNHVQLYLGLEINQHWDLIVDDDGFLVKKALAKEPILIKTVPGLLTVTLFVLFF